MDAVTHDEDIDRSFSAAAAAMDQQNTACTYPGNDNGTASIPSESQNDYQQPLSISSDQWSGGYDPTLHKDELPAETGREHAELPLYVNTSELAADAGAENDVGDGGSSEYMQVLTYNADDEADNVYLSLLDIVSMEERQIEVSNSLTLQSPSVSSYTVTQ